MELGIVAALIVTLVAVFWVRSRTDRLSASTERLSVRFGERFGRGALLLFVPLLGAIGMLAAVIAESGGRYRGTEPFYGALSFGLVLVGLYAYIKYRRQL